MGIQSLKKALLLTVVDFAKNDSQRRWWHNFVLNLLTYCLLNSVKDLRKKARY